MPDLKIEGWTSAFRNWLVLLRTRSECLDFPLHVDMCLVQHRSIWARSCHSLHPPQMTAMRTNPTFDLRRGMGTTAPLSPTALHYTFCTAAKKRSFARPSAKSGVGTTAMRTKRPFAGVGSLAFDATNARQARQWEGASQNGRRASTRAASSVRPISFRRCASSCPSCRRCRAMRKRANIPGRVEALV